MPTWRSLRNGKEAKKWDINPTYHCGQCGSVFPHQAISKDTLHTTPEKSRHL